MKKVMNTLKISRTGQIVPVKTTNKLLCLVLALFAFLGLAIQAQAQPTTSAATPTLPQGRVISLWNSSGTYTNVAVQNYFEFWWAVDPYFYTMPDTGSNVLLYADMSCCGAITTGTNAPVNASGCTNLHLDVYTPSGNNLKIRLVDTSNRSADVLYSVAGGVITNGGWIGLDISLVLFTSANPLMSLSNIRQIGLIDSEGGGGEVLPASYYIDNVYFSAATNLVFTPPPAIPVPTNNAATPTNSPVLSLYNSSGTYTDVPASQWPTTWSGSACTPFVITNTGSTVKYMPGLTYVGVQYPANSVDTTGYNTLHFDVWTLDGNQLGIKLVSLSPTADPLVINSIGVTQQWVSVNIPLSYFTATNPALILTNIEQVLFVDNVGSGVQNATFYIDNVYFYSNAVVTPPPPAVTNNLVANWNFETNAATSTGLASWETAGSGGAIATPVTINTTDPYAGLQAISIEGQGTGGVGAGPVIYQNTIPVVPGTLTLSFYAKAAIKDGGATPQYQISWRNAADAQIGVSGFSSWPTALSTSAYTLETISGLTAPAGSDHCTITLLLAVGAGTGDHWKVLVDNLALVQNTVTPPSTVIDYPTNAAPNPTPAQANVVSLYNSSGNYTNVNIDTWLTAWSQATYAPYTITNASRVVKRYSNLNYAGVEFFNPMINASGMTTLHVDLWTPNASKFSVKLVSFSPGAAEYEVVFTNNVIVTNQWVGLDIPVSTFTSGNPAMNFANLGQLLFINNNPGGPQLGTFYIDNVYFYTSAVAPTSPTITSPSVSGGNFTLQVNSQTGYNYILQGTPSLAPASWTNIQTNAGTGGVLNFSVPVSSGNPQQFYRVNVQ